MIEIHPSNTQGKCIECRHSSIETIDFKEDGCPGCKFGVVSGPDKICDQQLKSRKTGKLVDLWLYEKYEQYDIGSNSTWFCTEQLKIVVDED